MKSNKKRLILVCCGISIAVIALCVFIVLAFNNRDESELDDSLVLDTFLTSAEPSYGDIAQDEQLMNMMLNRQRLDTLRDTLVLSEKIVECQIETIPDVVSEPIDYDVSEMFIIVSVTLSDNELLSNDEESIILEIVRSIFPGIVDNQINIIVSIE